MPWTTGGGGNGFVTPDALKEFVFHGNSNQGAGVVTIHYRFDGLEPGHRPIGV